MLNDHRNQFETDTGSTSYATVSEFREFVARRGSGVSSISRFKEKLHKFMHQKNKSIHEQFLKTIDNNVHSEILNLMMDVCWLV